MRRKIGIVCMLTGVVLILAALSLFLWNRYEDSRAGAAADKLLPQVVDRIDAGAHPNPYHTEMTEVEMDGYTYVGYLSIPAMELDLPVMTNWSYAQLKIAPCRYTGSTKTDDLVIAAHNYSRHFGNIKGLSVGDAVYFTDMEGMVSAYEVAELDVLPPYAVEEMTSSGYALTLFTCSYGGRSRVTVRCRNLKENNKQ